MDKGLIRVSVITICHDGSGKYLLGKRSQNCRDEQGKWEPVGGGGLKFGETIEGSPTHWLAMDFRALIDPAEAKIGEPHKCDEQRWVTIDELASMEDLHSQFPAFLEKYKDVLV